MTLSPEQRYDVVVIGGGTAGLVTAAGAARVGARAALIERDRLGGECLWTGCVPSKALLRSAQAAHDARRGSDFGLQDIPVDPRLDRVLDSMRQVIARIQPHDDPERFRAMGVEVIQGSATLQAPGRVRVDGREMEARRIVIATGSRPVIPPIEGLESVGYLTHESIIELEERPGRLLVLGAGPVGLEFAQIFVRLGSRVTVIEMAATILPREDEEVSGRLQACLEAEGIEFRLASRAVSARPSGDGGKALELIGPDGQRLLVTGDEILVATGMRPYTAGLGLENVGVELDERGAVRVDDRLRTTAPGIWAAGDVTGILFFTHVAEYQARLLVRNMFFPIRGKADYGAVPWAIYTDPALARVGLTESQARDRHGDRVGVYRAELDDLDRAIADRASHGLVKLITDRRGHLLGAHILAAHADALIHEPALAMRTGARVGQLSQMVHAYPTLPEAIRRAADGYYADKLESSWIGRLLRWWVRRA